jgi:hypothetical protein
MFPFRRFVGFYQLRVGGWQNSFLLYGVVLKSAMSRSFWVVGDRLQII